MNLTQIISFFSHELLVFIISAILLIIGIGLFNFGAGLAMQPMGEQVGASLMKTKKTQIITIVCFVMGLLITIAKPDLSVLGSQVKAVINPTLLIGFVGIGVGLFLVIAILKICFKKDLSMMLMFFYMLMFAVAGIVIQLEKEVVLILVNKEIKDSILHAIYQKVGLNSPGQGIAFSVPVDEVIGLSN